MSMISPLLYLRNFDFWVILLLIICEVARMCGILLIFWSKANSALFVVQVGIVVYFCIMEASRANFWPALSATIFFVAMLFECWQYQLASGISANYFALLKYTSLLFYVPFRYAQCSIGRVLWCIFGIVVVYALIYTIFNKEIISLGAASDISLLTQKSDGTRGDRAVLASGLIAFGIYFAFSIFRRYFFLSIPAICLFAYALYLAQGRMFTMIIIAVTLAMLICMILPWLRRLVAVGASAALSSLYIYSISGYFISDINPYTLIYSDATGRARFFEYRAAVSYFIPERFLTGMGIAPSTEESQMFVQSLAPFFASDLGAAGIYFTFGFIGWLLALALSLIMIFAIPDKGRSAPTQIALYYGVFAASIMGFFAPSIFGGESTLLAMLTLAAIARGDGMGFLMRSQSAAMGRLVDNNS